MPYVAGTPVKEDPRTRRRPDRARCRCSTAAAEELGWSGYATDPLQERANALQASVQLGLVHAVWHIVPLVQAGRPAEWIAWWFLYTVGLRVLAVWIYNDAGRSVFATALFHAMCNAGTVPFLAYYGPRGMGPVTAVAAAIVPIGWGPRALARQERA